MSHDTSFVQACDPAALWEFQVGETKMIGTGAVPGVDYARLLGFRVDSIGAGMIEGTEFFNDQEVHGTLYLNRPVVIVQSEDNEPMVTLTLRLLQRRERAFIQVTVSAAIPIARRQ